jgi:Tol biopolymer transport system component
MDRQSWKMIVATLVFGLFVLALACVLQPISWSPDGRWIAATRWTEDKQVEGNKKDVGELWIVSPKPIERRRLLVTPGTMLSGPAWSPDSKSMYVVDLPSEKTSGPAILRWVPLEGKAREIVRIPVKDEAGGAVLSAPAIAPDGKRIAFIRDKASVVIATTEGRVVRVIEEDEPGSVLWSPDGRWLVVLGGNDQSLAVHFYDTQSSESVTLDMRYRTIVWLPDGKRYVTLKKLSEGGSEKSAVAIVEGITSRREVASFDLSFSPAASLVLSPKGDAAFLGREGSSEVLPGICKLDLSDGKSQVVYETPGPVVAWSVSPDGRALAFRESGIGKDSGGDSIIGVLDLRETTEPLYLAFDDTQLAGMLKAYAEEMKKAEPAKFTPAEQKAARLSLVQLERFLTAFRRDFPKSSLLPECTEAVKGAVSTLKQAGITASPAGGTMKWLP